jgi:hypothetical protein
MPMLSTALSSSTFFFSPFSDILSVAQRRAALSGLFLAAIGLSPVFHFALDVPAT